MTKEEAIYYLKSSGMSDEQIKSVIDAFTCEDCISRQAVLDTIGNVPDYDDGMVWEALSHAQRDVALLPSVTPKVEWIPVSEPPKKSGEYLLDSEDFGIFVGDYDADMKSFGWWREDYEYDPDTIACIGREFIKFEGVLAWRELPERYKAESEDKE